MPASQVQISLGLPQLNLPTHIPATCPMAYNVSSEDRLLVPDRARSQPLGESSQGPSYGRRTQSESSLDAPASTTVPRSPPATDNAAPDQAASAPSPVPTEIIPPDLTQEEIVVDIQRSGIKVCDFAYECNVSVEQRAPELFDPIIAWYTYESLLANADPQRRPLNGRQLRRLLDIGWVSEEADKLRWGAKDRESLELFDSRPHYPWKSLDLTKPKKDELIHVAESRFHLLHADQLGPQFISSGISRLATVIQSSRAAVLRYQKRSHANDATVGAEEQPQTTSPKLKKIRLSTGTAMATSASRSRSVPSAPLARVLLDLVDGNPPQQFPAGRPSDFPASTSTVTQSKLTRSLQRSLSMTVMDSTHSTDLTCSDSRTTLTEGASQE